MKLKNIRISPIQKKKDIKRKSKDRKKLSSRRKKISSKKMSRKKSFSSKKFPRKKVSSVSSKKKSNLYCGNNRLDPSILNGTKIIGTRNRCLRLGFGAGYHSPVDPNYTDDYEPIDIRKFYCGDKEILPTGYDAVGNLPICLRKGFGMGVRKRFLELAR